MCKRKTSGYVHTGCGCGKAKVEAKAKKPSQPQSPQTSTEKDAKEEAEKYSNTEVPVYNKLFIGTLIAVGILVLSSEK